ncbi:MAG: DedA family protein [Thermomicrobiales bacterium]|nr:DedA family protein [Thermomicrobiales bacterium]
MEIVTGIVDALGYAGLAVLIALENVFPPIPSEVILPLAGFNVQMGSLSFTLVLLATTFGSVVGALILYGLGAWFGADRVRWFFREHGRKVLLKEADVDKAIAWFDRYGSAAVFFCRMLPVVRSLISIPAGLDRMSLPRFVLLTAAGSALWNAALVGAGWALGTQWDTVERYIEVLQYVVIAALVLLAVGFLRQRLLSARQTATR